MPSREFFFFDEIVSLHLHVVTFGSRHVDS